MNPPLNKPELAIIILMRIMGVGGLLAILAIFLPYSWMNSIHEFMFTAICQEMKRSSSFRNPAATYFRLRLHQ
jgi:hypothetical protein